MEKGGAVRTAAALTPFFEWAGTLANIIEPAGFGEYSPAFFHAEVGTDLFLLPVEWGILL